MRQLLVLMIGLLLSLGVPFSAQENVRPEANLVRRYERGCGYSCFQELAIDLGGVYANKVDDTVVIRFCSKEPLSLALTTAAAAFPEYLISILVGSYNYTPERIFFLRSEDCLGSDPLIAATEFWAVPKGAAPPSSIESAKSSQVQINSLGMEVPIKSERLYSAARQKLPEKLHANPQALGVVVGYYYKSPSPALKQRLREIRKLLERSGLPRDRYFVRLAKWTGEYGDDDPEPTYPSLFVVKIAKPKDSARK